VLPRVPLSGPSLSQAVLWLWPVVLPHSVAEWAQGVAAACTSQLAEEAGGHYWLTEHIETALHHSRLQNIIENHTIMLDKVLTVNVLNKSLARPDTFVR